MNWQEVYDMAKELAYDAGELIKARMEGAIDINSKKDANDLVTNVDLEVEAFISERVLCKYPDHQILGEEGIGKSTLSKDKITWIIDPIDGTVNFVHQRRNFAILISVYDGEVGKVSITYDVMCNEMFHCLKGNGAYFNDTQLSKLQRTSIAESVIGFSPTQRISEIFGSDDEYKTFVKSVRASRSLGSAGIHMAYVATGWLDAYIKRKLNPWDFAAGKILIEEVGGQVVDISGDAVSVYGASSIIAAKPGYYDEFSEKFL